MFNRFVAGFLVLGFLVSVVPAGFAESSYVVVPSQRTFVSAETRLKEFAKKAENARMLTAMSGIGAGVLYVALGSASSKSYYSTNNSSIYYAMGVGMGILGVSSLMCPTELENSFARIKKMPDVSLDERASRERFAEKTFKNGAEEANRGRVMGAAAISVLGLATMSSGFGVLYVALGAMTYVMKSEIEKGYDEYVSEKEDFLRSQRLEQETSFSSSEGAVLDIQNDVQ